MPHLPGGTLRGAEEGWRRSGSGFPRSAGVPGTALSQLRSGGHLPATASTHPHSRPTQAGPQPTLGSQRPNISHCWLRHLPTRRQEWAQRDMRLLRRVRGKDPDPSSGKSTARGEETALHPQLQLRPACGFTPARMPAMGNRQGRQERSGPGVDTLGEAGNRPAHGWRNLVPVTEACGDAAAAAAALRPKSQRPRLTIIKVFSESVGVSVNGCALGVTVERCAKSELQTIGQGHGAATRVALATRAAN
ncbi:hypothetical protein H8959_004069 [Pygathrix nigripes]